MANVQAALQELRQIVGKDGVLDQPEELLVYECDGFSVARATPTAVVFPRRTEQVAACVGALNRHGLGMVPRGSGTGLAGGCVAFAGEVLISTVRMNQIETIDWGNRVAVVQAGVLNTALSEAVARGGMVVADATPSPGLSLREGEGSKTSSTSGGASGGGLHFSPDPSSQRASTIGGNAATNAGGINTLKHGVTSNHILGMEMVLADGSIMRTRAGSLLDGIGPDLPGLVCGSEGTLGIITRLWCRLVPKPRHFRTIYAVYGSTGQACLTVSDVIAAGIVPTSMEMMDGRMIRVVEEAFHYGFPTDAQALLLIEVDGVDQILDEQVGQILELCRKHGATDVQHCADAKRRLELWSARKRAFGAIGRLHVAYFTQDACVPRSLLPVAIERICQIGRDFGLQINNVFHAGDGNVHPIFFFDESDPAQAQAALRAAEKALEYCISIGGTITGEHGVGVEKLAMMEHMFNPDTIRAFQAIKGAFDPQERINVGKLIPSDKIRVQLVKPLAANVPGGAL
ncbi:MAG: FAD-binding protein [Phycisphaeraceae bacterium]|nr:FAD-binding protein [Phycisphaeraceae bacterium]